MIQPLRPYQAEYAYSDWAFAPAFYLAYDPRLGKTRAEVTAIVRRQHERGVARTLIVGPKNPLRLTWTDELERAGYRRPSAGGGIGYYVPLVESDTAWRAEVLEDLIAGAAGNTPVVLLLNFDTLDVYFERIERVQDSYLFRGEAFGTLAEARLARARSSSKKLSDLLSKWGPEAIIVDEAHLISSAGAHRSRALRRLARGAGYRRLLSGTPDPQRAPSFYAQYVVLDPSVFGTSKKAFLDRYFHLNPFIQNKPERMRLEREGEFYERVLSIMQRVKAEDYFGPSAWNEVTRHLDFPPRARKLYDELAKESVLAEDYLTVDGTHRLTKLLRHLQLCAGFLVDEGTGDLRWIHHTKTDAVLSDLTEPLAMGQRVVISYAFTAAGEALRKAIGHAHGVESVALVNGHTPEAETLAALSVFDVNSTAETPLRVLVIQEQVGGVGISLARARHLFFHSWSMDPAMHEQMRRRIWHPGLTSHITYFQMRNSADGFAKRVVKEKLDASVMLRGRTNFLEFLTL